MPQAPPRHQPPHWKPYAKRPDPAHQRYHTAAWARIRKRIIARDGNRCTASACQTPGRGFGGRLIVDHIRAVKDGGSDADGNLRTLCPACDNRRHASKGGLRG